MDWPKHIPSLSGGLKVSRITKKVLGAWIWIVLNWRSIDVIARKFRALIEVTVFTRTLLDPRLYSK
jgi:hypothetical protein